MKNVSQHYDENYFKWQSTLGNFGGWAGMSKFSKYINEDDLVMDFGCGGGFLLKNIKCKSRIGVEVNKVAAKQAVKNGLKVFDKIKKVPSNYVDVIISNHALEHSLNPFFELKEMCRILKRGGKLIIYVPCESVFCKYHPSDINHHVFSWSPSCLGNLLQEAGFELIESKAFFHKWPPKSVLYGKFLGRWLFELMCRIYGIFTPTFSQVKAVALKK